MKRVLIQSGVGLTIVVATFVGGTVLCGFCIPDTGVKYLNERGEMIVGALIFAVTVAVALLARFDKRTLFITAGLVPALIIGLAFLLHTISPSYGLGGIYWAGLLRDTLFVCRHTALPVGLSAAVVFLIRVIHAQLGAAPSGGQHKAVADAGAAEGPSSVS